MLDLASRLSSQLAPSDAVNPCLLKPPSNMECNPMCYIMYLGKFQCLHFLVSLWKFRDCFFTGCMQQGNKYFELLIPDSNSDQHLKVEMHSFKPRPKMCLRGSQHCSLQMGQRADTFSITLNKTCYLLILCLRHLHLLLALFFFLISSEIFWSSIEDRSNFHPLSCLFTC